MANMVGPFTTKEVLKRPYLIMKDGLYGNLAANTPELNIDLKSNIISLTQILKKIAESQREIEKRFINHVLKPMLMADQNYGEAFVNKLNTINLDEIGATSQLISMYSAYKMGYKVYGDNYKDWLDECIKDWVDKYTSQGFSKQISLVMDKELQLNPRLTIEDILQKVEENLQVELSDARGAAIYTTLLQLLRERASSLKTSSIIGGTQYTTAFDIPFDQLIDYSYFSKKDKDMRKEIEDALAPITATTGSETKKIRQNMMDDLAKKPSKGGSSAYNHLIKYYGTLANFQSGAKANILEAVKSYLLNGLIRGIPSEVSSATGKNGISIGFQTGDVKADGVDIKTDVLLCEIITQLENDKYYVNPTKLAEIMKGTKTYNEMLTHMHNIATENHDKEVFFLHQSAKDASEAIANIASGDSSKKDWQNKLKDETKTFDTRIEDLQSLLNKYAGDVLDVDRSNIQNFIFCFANCLNDMLYCKANVNEIKNGLAMLIFAFMFEDAGDILATAINKDFVTDGQHLHVYYTGGQWLTLSDLFDQMASKIEASEGKFNPSVAKRYVTFSWKSYTLVKDEKDYYLSHGEKEDWESLRKIMFQNSSMGIMKMSTSQLIKDLKLLDPVAYF